MNNNSIFDRSGWCWCPELDLVNGVTAESLCKVCHKIVAIINLAKFRSQPCSCIGPPVSNQFRFCVRCRGTIRLHNGSLAREAFIAIKRAEFMAENATLRQ
jgi:hypothetical protein